MKRLLPLLFFLAACQEARPPKTEAWALRQQYRDGFLALELRLDRSRLALHERLRLRLDFFLADEAGLRKEAIALPGWTVLEDRREAPRLLPDGRRALRRSLLLEPFLPGDYAIPPLAFRARNAAGSEGRILTEAIAVTVDGALSEEQQKEPGPLSPPPEPLSLRYRKAEASPLWILAPGLGAAALIALLLLRRRRPLPSPPAEGSNLEDIVIGAEAAARRSALDLLEPALRRALGARLGREQAAALTIDELLSDEDPERERWEALLRAVAEARYRGRSPEASELEAWLKEGRSLAREGER